MASLKGRPFEAQEKRQTDALQNCLFSMCRASYASPWTIRLSAWCAGANNKNPKHMLDLYGLLGFLAWLAFHLFLYVFLFTCLCLCSFGFVSWFMRFGAFLLVYICFLYVCFVFCLFSCVLARSTMLRWDSQCIFKHSFEAKQNAAVDFCLPFWSIVLKLSRMLTWASECIFQA